MRFKFLMKRDRFIFWKVPKSRNGTLDRKRKVPLFLYSTLWPPAKFNSVSTKVMSKAGLENDFLRICLDDNLGVETTTVLI